VGHKNLVFGLLDYKVCKEFCSLLWFISTVEPIARREPKLAHKVVMELSRDIEGKGCHGNVEV
jgi:hypothetical protein